MLEQIFSRFNFKIVYFPGRKNGTADALTKKIGRGDEIFLSQSQIILKPQNLRILANTKRRNRNLSTNASPVTENEFQINNEDREDFSNIHNLLKTAYRNEDDITHTIIKPIFANKRQNKVFRNFRIFMADWEVRNQKLFYKKRLFVPEDKNLKFQIIKQAHFFFKKAR